jgi:hypothetical protein
MTVQRRVFKSQDQTAAETARGDAVAVAGEISAPAPADVAPDAESPLGRARSALATTDAELARLAGERDAALLADDDAGAIELDRQIEAVQRLRKAHADKVALRQREAERAAAAARSAEKVETIVGIEQLFAERDRLAGMLSEHIAGADAAFRGLFEISHEIRRRWPFAAHDLAAMQVADGPLALAVQHEIYRLAGRPHQPGAPVGDHKPPSFPGGRAERLEHALQPDKIEPLAKKLEVASALASRVMREGFSTNQLDPAQAGPAAVEQSAPTVTGPDPAPSPFNGTPNPELAQVLSRMNALSSRQMSDEDEREYQELGRKVQELSA